MRSILTVVHRYVGLSIALFVTVAALTGSLLAWNAELERLFAPALFILPDNARQMPPLDVFELRDRVAKAFPDATVDGVDFTREPDAPALFSLSEKPGHAALENDEIAVDPASGAILGARRNGDITQGVKNFMPFVYRLHESLALGAFGELVLGCAALLWTIDCFIGAYLTFPVRAAIHRTPLSWLSRWRRAWTLRWPTTGWKLSFDLHRAGGLWPWLLLGTLAWSSVAFNLPQVYRPVTAALFGHDRTMVAGTATHNIDRAPKLDWRAGYLTARKAIDEAAASKGFTILSERLMFYNAETHSYSYRVRSDRDPGKFGSTQVHIDADDGHILGIDIPTGRQAGATFTTWIEDLHTANVFGRAMQVLICLTGIVIAMLSVTGLIIYLRKLKARLRHRYLSRLASR